jgi:hypothetical protein
MPYCRYCLKDTPIEEMPSPRTCVRCRNEQLAYGAVKAKKQRKSRITRAKNAVAYYFLKKRIKHRPFPQDIVPIQVLLRQMISANRYKKNFLHVDHAIPVDHPLVCGLTVSWNLQILLRHENIRKANTCDFEFQEAWLMRWAKERGL